MNFRRHTPVGYILLYMMSSMPDSSFILFRILINLALYLFLGSNGNGLHA